MRARISLSSAVLACLLAPLAVATVVVAMDIEDMAAVAPVVVVGEVNRVEADWNPQKTKIYTQVLITPEEVLKGPRQLGTVKLKMLGGRVGDVVADMIGAPHFEQGERVLVFLEPRKDNDGYLTIGMYQGKFKVFRDPDTGEELLLRDGPAPGVRIVGADAARGAEPALRLADVRATVREMGGVK